MLSEGELSVDGTLDDYCKTISNSRLEMVLNEFIWSTATGLDDDGVLTTTRGEKRESRVGQVFLGVDGASLS